MATMEVFRTYYGRDNYVTWEKDLDFYRMGRHLDGGKAAQQTQCLGLFMFNGGSRQSRVKEVYTLHKDDEKGDARHNNYQHAGAMVKKKLMTEKNQTYETFQFRNIKQSTGELFEDFTHSHRCEVAVASCGFNMVECGC